MSEQNKTGIDQFQELFNELETKFPWVFPKIYRKKSIGWVAEIFKRPEDDYPIGSGQGPTMENACLTCYKDYHYKINRENRKKTLLENENVREALRLYGVEYEDDLD